MTIRKRSILLPFLSEESPVFIGFCRYSEFESLRERLILTFPNCKGSMPALPPKSVFCTIARAYSTFLLANTLTFSLDRFRPDFLEKRRAGLAYFLKFVHSHSLYVSRFNGFSCVLLNPDFSSSPITKDFIFN